jgi:acyl carrier protein
MKWTRPRIESALREELARALEIPEADIQLGSRLLADLGAESIDLIDLAFRLESRFQISLPEGISLDIARSGRRDPTVGDLADEISDRLK